MKKNFLKLIIIFFYSNIIFATTINDAKKLVKFVCHELKVKKSSIIFKKINKGKHPYRNKKDPNLYVFVYDENACSMAHYSSAVRGKCFKGKTDIKGKKFRDEIVNGAKTKKQGEVTYYYIKPNASGIHRKKAFYKLCPSTNKKNYIVVSGIYEEE